MKNLPAFVRPPCLAGFLLSLLCAVPSYADDPTLTAEQLAPIRHALSELIETEMKAKKIAGLSLALVENQKITWATGFGFADKSLQRPARAETLYSVGALSTLLTASAVLQYVDQGAIDLDQPIKKYLPDFSIRSRFGNVPPITPRNLLSHHSGLPAMHFKDMWAEKSEPLTAFVNRLKDEYVAYPPGHVFSPSFPGYDVLGRVVETQCKKAFALCLQERVLAPLGMKQSTFDFNRANRDLLARHYWKEKPIPLQTMRDIPAAGLITNVNELARFMQMLIANGKFEGQQILKSRSVQEMLHAQNDAVTLDLDTRVGLGWRLSGVHLPTTRSVAWLSNESPFSRGRMILVPEHKLGVVVLTNNSNSTELVEKASERLLELVLQTRKPVVTVKRRAIVTPTPVHKRDDIIGPYATSFGLISVTTQKGRYRAHMLGKTLNLTRNPDGLFSPEYRLLGLIPIPISVLKEARLTTLKIDKRHLAVAYYRNQSHRLGERIEPRPLPEVWRKRLGEYQAEERDLLLKLVKFGPIGLEYNNGLLTLRYRVPGWLGMVATIPVRPVSDTELVIEGTGWLMGETVHIVQRGGQERLRYSGYELRPVARP